MKTETKNRTLCFIALLFIAQCLVVTKVWAEYIDIPQQTIKSKWGTINIMEQSIPDNPSSWIECTITDVPKGFRFECFLYDNKWTDVSGRTSIHYERYKEMKSIEVVAAPLPITSPSGLVDVINAFVPDGAIVNDKGEVVIKKEVVRPSMYEDAQVDFYTGIQDWPIQADLTIMRQNRDAGILGFDFDIENSNIITDGVMSYCTFELTNSSIGCKKNGEFGCNYTIASARGNVVFKGIGDDGEEFGNDLCNGGRPYVVSLDFYDGGGNPDGGIKNSTISFEDLAVSYSTLNGDFIIPASATVKMKNCSVDYNNLNVQGGKVHFENCLLYQYEPSSPILTVESGSLEIDNSEIIGSINVNGTDAKFTANSGRFDGLVVVSGKATINNGYFPNGITVNGGSLEVNNGTIKTLNVTNEKCEIDLNNGHFSSVYMPIDVKKSIQSLLGANASFYDRDGTYMPFKLVDIDGVDITEGQIITGTAYPVSFVFSNYGSTPSAAYTAAQRADVGPEGKDIRVRDNGDLEIWTPDGMAWLAFVHSDTHDRVLTGREYYEKSRDWYLMADLDMDGYGTGWPELSVTGRTFYGQQHRIYNMNVLRPDASFLSTIDYKGVVRDLIVEGSVTNQDDEGGRSLGDYGYTVSYNLGGFVYDNRGLIVNCAFKGGVWNAAIGDVVSVAGFVNMNSGRIENCYVAPCGQLVGGVRNAADGLTLINKMLPCPNAGGTYRVGGFALSNTCDYIIYEDGRIEYLGGLIENCYFGGQVVYNTPSSDSDNIYTIEISSGLLSNRGYPCDRLYYLDSDISAETLNKNSLDHTSSEYNSIRYPYVEWAQWKESAGKQCGKPYFVWEKNIDDTPSVIDAVDAGNGFKVWSEDGAICFSNVQSADVSVYSVSGELVKQERGRMGTGRITLPKGLYVVKCGSVTKKVML